MRDSSNATLSPARIALGYAIVSTLWIAFSDGVLESLGAPKIVMTLKGILFVIVTAIMLYLTIRKLVQTVRLASDERDETLSLYETLVASSEEGICLLDDNGRITFCNSKFASLFHRPLEQLNSRKLDELLTTATTRSDIPLGETGHVRELQLGDATHPTWVLMSTTQLPNRNGSTARGRLVLLLDITERKRLESELRQSQKLEALGSFAGGITHDFNNLLAIISGYAAVLQKNLRSGTQESTAMHEILNASHRGAALVRQLLAFSRKQPIHMEMVDVCEHVSGFAEILPRIVGEHINVKVACEPDTGWVNVGAGQLEQLLMNLAANARDAMQGGGTLAVRTASVDIGREHADAHNITPGPFTRLEVRDTGSGIPPEVKAHIFEPFFTTKGVGVGTGLGLSTVYGIVVQNGGFITCDSTVGEGTTFCIYLPKEPPPAGTAQPTGPQTAAGVTGTETVMLVEDEPALRVLTKHILTTHGYTVLEASNGVEALQLAETSDGKIDLVLTDIVMPGMGGVELVRKLSESHHDLTVVFMSGYSDVPLDEEYQIPIIQKPMPPDDLLTELRTILDRSRKTKHKIQGPRQ